MEVGERIKELRLKHGWSQGELASKLGYKDKTTISKIESGINEVNQSKLVKFADVLGVTPSYLMGWIDLQSEQDYLSALDKSYEEDLDLNVYCQYGYEAYCILELVKKIDAKQRQHLFKYCKLLCEQDTVNMPSDDDIKKKARIRLGYNREDKKDAD